MSYQRDNEGKEPQPWTRLRTLSGPIIGRLLSRDPRRPLPFSVVQPLASRGSGAGTLKDVVRHHSPGLKGPGGHINIHSI